MTAGEDYPPGTRTLRVTPGGNVMRTVIVRPAERSDLAGIGRVESHLSDPWDARQHRAFAAEPLNLTLVAVDGKAVLGFACGSLTKREFLVERVGVLPAERRQWLGRSLLWSFSERLPGWVRAMQAVAGEYDVASQLFLKACGWQCVKTLRWGDGPDEYLFEWRRP